MRNRRPALQEWGGRKFHSLNGLSRRLRENGEALRVGVCPDTPAPSWWRTNSSGSASPPWGLRGWRHGWALGELVREWGVSPDLMWILAASLEMRWLPPSPLAFGWVQPMSRSRQLPPSPPTWLGVGPTGFCTCPQPAQNRRMGRCFPDGSVGNESACKARDTGDMDPWEMQVQSLDQEDP